MTFLIGGFRLTNFGDFRLTVFGQFNPTLTTLHPTMSNLAESCFTVNLKFYANMFSTIF